MAVAGILLYLTITISYPSSGVFSPLAYLYGRISGILLITLTYFLWSVPFATLIVFSTAFLSAFTFTADMESNMRYFVYALPAKRQTLMLSKFSSAFLISSSVAVLFYVIQGVSLSFHFMAFPPMQFFVSFLLTLLVIGTVVSITFFIGMFMKSATFVVIAFLSIYFIVMNTIGIASEILVGKLPLFLVSSAGAIISEIFSGVNLVPFGSAGTVAGASHTTIVIDIMVLLMYLITGLLSTHIMFTARDVK